jgi:hypothetical protein
LWSLYRDRGSVHLAIVKSRSCRPGANRVRPAFVPTTRTKEKT